MNEKLFYKISLVIPIVVPAICLLITPSDLDSIPWLISQILMATNFSGLVGGIPYLIFAASLLIWMQNKNLSQIRKVLLLSPLLFIPIVILCVILVFLIGTPESITFGTAIQVLLLYSAIFTGCVLVFGYFYVSITFGVARLFRGKPFSKVNS